MSKSRAEKAPKHFGRILRRIRRELGLSQEELGARIGAAPGYISLVENGEKNISLVTLTKLSEALNLKIKFGDFELLP